jgi:hypothetical protein
MIIIGAYFYSKYEYFYYLYNLIIKIETKMADIEYIIQDDIYYWLVFTVFFSIASIIGAIIFIATYKFMVYLRDERLRKKAKKELGP